MHAHSRAPRHARTHAATHAHTQSPCKTQTQETAANVGERVEEGRQSGSQVGGSACVTLSLLLGRPALVACTLFRECVLSPSCSSPFLRSSQLPRLTYIHTHTGCRGGACTRGQSCTTAQCRGEGSGDRREGCCGGEGTGACLLGLLSATALRCRQLWCKRGCSFPCIQPCKPDLSIYNFCTQEGAKATKESVGGAAEKAKEEAGKVRCLAMA